MKARTLLDLGCACETCRKGGQGCRDYPTGIIPAGTVVDWPDCYKLVYVGAADPADDECVEAVTLTPEEIVMVQRAQLRAASGIHPEDFEAFDAGEMIGYAPDGSHIPGPNATFSEEEMDYDESEFSDF